MSENFYEKLGFKKENEFWVFNTDNTMNKPEHIKVEKNEWKIVSDNIQSV